MLASGIADFSRRDFRLGQIAIGLILLQPLAVYALTIVGLMQVALGIVPFNPLPVAVLVVSLGLFLYLRLHIGRGWLFRLYPNWVSFSGTFWAHRSWVETWRCFDLVTPNSSSSCCWKPFSQETRPRPNASYGEGQSIDSTRMVRSPSSAGVSRLPPLILGRSLPPSERASPHPRIPRPTWASRRTSRSSSCRRRTNRAGAWEPGHPEPMASRSHRRTLRGTVRPPRHRNVRPDAARSANSRRTPRSGSCPSPRRR